jgi:hypothetical protein
MYVVYSSIDLVGVTTVDLLVLFLILLPRFLNVRLVAVSQRVLIIVAGVLDILTVGARNRAVNNRSMSYDTGNTHASFAGSTAGG